MFSTTLQIRMATPRKILVVGNDDHARFSMTKTLLRRFPIDEWLQLGAMVSEIVAERGARLRTAGAAGG